MERDRNGVAKRRLKIRRKYQEESADTFESVGKGDYCRATFPFGRCANRTKHTNTASVSDKIAIRARKKQRFRELWKRISGEATFQH